MAMDCAQFAEAVHDLERVGTTGFAQRTSAMEHAETCARCGLLFEKVMSLDFALDVLAGQDALEQAPPRVEAALLAEFRRQRAAARPQRNFRLVAALSTAAALILAAGILAPRVGQTKDVASAVTASGVSNGSSGAVIATGAGQGAEQSGGADTTGTAAADDSEYATNFIALPYADDPGTLNDGTVVRVTLSRATLASFGMPVADLTSTADRIPADIALSEDGVPQAIRLVASESLDQSN
jgi:hypothetical protein